MTEHERWEYLVDLDDDLLKGGVMLSEWCSMIVREADTAFAHGAHLASILTAVSAIETHLRSESVEGRKLPLVELIKRADVEEQLREDLHRLRKYRNKWVHVDLPWDAAALLESTESVELELEQMAQFAARVLRRTIYSNPWI